MQNGGQSCANAAPTRPPVRPPPGCAGPGCFTGIFNHLKGPVGSRPVPRPGQYPGRAQPGRRPAQIDRPGPVPGLSPLSSPGSPSGPSPGSPTVTLMDALRRHEEESRKRYPPIVNSGKGGSG
uniref:Uncharacterized protein n=1 Tax=Rhipicephalus zambeziensis TaxID=60191 RepID=A0A224Y999_9ACAR